MSLSLIQLASLYYTAFDTVCVCKCTRTAVCAAGRVVRGGGSKYGGGGGRREGGERMEVFMGGNCVLELIQEAV